MTNWFISYLRVDTEGTGLPGDEAPGHVVRNFMPERDPDQEHENAKARQVSMPAGLFSLQQRDDFGNGQ